MGMDVTVHVSPQTKEMFKAVQQAWSNHTGRHHTQDDMIRAMLGLLVDSADLDDELPPRLREMVPPRPRGRTTV